MEYMPNPNIFFIFSGNEIDLRVPVQQKFNILPEKVKSSRLDLESVYFT